LRSDASDAEITSAKMNIDRFLGGYSAKRIVHNPQKVRADIVQIHEMNFSRRIGIDYI
jgi:hypothetical protein